MCSSEEESELEDWTLGIGDMELVQEDVGPDEIFQRERVQTDEKREAALSLNFAATFRGKQRRGGQRREPGKKWPER